ncbi:hypothetical protein HGRIS_010273 [Hohenbuehelia grisea]|uniref:C2H2-type domain-containing protein n=1 Tax=Hohenbuehelia grisea TaxID=104357 RepID=A0ABR3J3T1_9AGAR
MVFGLFSRKETKQLEPLAQVVGPHDLTGRTHPLDTGSHEIPSDSPSPKSESPCAVDTSDLLELIRSVPAKTLHTYTLTHLASEPVSHPTYAALSSFFSTLTPPPTLHCARCHKSFTDIANDDRACRVAHDDDSAEVARVRYPGVSSSEFETLYGCCGKTVEGEGDMGPPDGWCYEGMHTTDFKRARFRADSTPQDDKLVSCSVLRCHDPPPSASPRSVRSGKSRKRSVSPMQGRGRKRAHRVLEEPQEGLGKDGYDSDTLTLTAAEPASTKHGISVVEAEHDEDDEFPRARGRSTARGRKPAKGRPTKKPRVDEVVVAEPAADNMDVDEAELTEHASDSDSGGPARRTRSRSRSRVRAKPSNSLIAVAAASQKRRHAAQSSQPKPLSKASTILSKAKSTTKAARSSTPGSAASSSRASTPHIPRASLPEVSTTPLKRTSTHSRSRSNVVVVDIPVSKPQARIRAKALREVVASSIEGET